MYGRIKRIVLSKLNTKRRICPLCTGIRAKLLPYFAHSDSTTDICLMDCRNLQPSLASCCCSDTMRFSWHRRSYALHPWSRHSPKKLLHKHMHIYVHIRTYMHICGYTHHVVANYLSVYLPIHAEVLCVCGHIMFGVYVWVCLCVCMCKTHIRVHTCVYNII